MSMVVVEKTNEIGQLPKTTWDYYDRFSIEQERDLKEHVRKYILDSLSSVLPAQRVIELITEYKVRKTEVCIIEDTKTFVKRDPAARNDLIATWRSYLSLKAVADYRISNMLHGSYTSDEDIVTDDQVAARQLSEQSKLATGVEIHPGARIGKRFTVDHGMATVLGETVIIGTDCYILQGVILGGQRIATNPTGQRHPILGNNVQIGGFARIFGSVRVGNDVVVSPHAVITEDIPTGSRVVVRSVNQIIKTPSKFF
jgi:serine O-acetyltransferase